MKKILNKQELSPKIIEGVTEIANVVKTTLGPGGLPILIERTGQQLNGEPLGPKITKDGVSVADECYSTDGEKDLIIQAVKSICRKTNTVAGDGTTSAIVLGEAILKETLKVLEERPELNPQIVRESIEAATNDVIAKLKELSAPIKDPAKIAQVATISANGDTEVGDIIGEAFNKVGAEGVVTVDEGHGTGVTLTVVDGYQINRGAEAQDRFFNNKDLTHFEAEEAKLIIFDGKIMNYLDLVPTLKMIVQSNNGKAPPIVVMANEFSREAIQFLLMQKAEAGLQFVAVRGPHTTHVRTGYYEDLAVMTGGTKLGNGNKNLQSATYADIGTVSKVVIDKYNTTFYEGHGSEKDILKRVKQLQAMKEKAESPYDLQLYNDRLASLTNGIAKIGVGGATDLEIKEKYDRIEDALNAARAAIEEGVVPGGGTTLLRLSQAQGTETIGREILSRALKAPFYQILSNIGQELSEEDLTKVLSEPNKVYDARNRQLVDGMEAGIIDPTKVVRTSLLNATSIAALLSTAGGGIIFHREKK